MPRFVILYHETPPAAGRPAHWDLMLEWGEALRTWAVLQQPLGDVCCPAQRLADHRLRYLDYEGPISGDRGSVRKWDQGTYQLLSESPGRIEIAVFGQRLAGNVCLTLAEHVEKKEASDQRWVFSSSSR